MRHSQYQMFYPWNGGLNTADDPIIGDPNSLQIADNIVIATSGSRKKRGGQAHYNTTAITVSAATQDMIWGTDYWANVASAKRQYFVAGTAQNKFVRSTNGTTWSSFCTISLTLTQGSVTSTVFNEDLIIGYSGTSVPLKWDNQNTAANLVVLGGSPPSGSIVQKNQSRVWIAGNAANPDRVYYSAVFNHESWTASSSLGTTSGFIDVMPGDGDPDGVTALFPEINQGGIYVAKRTKIYFIDTSSASPASWRVRTISDGIGCIAHNTAVAVDQKDVIFCSERGIHALSQVIQTTAVLQGEFLSRSIHPDYTTVIDQANLKKMSAVWYPILNSYMLSCKRTGVSTYETLYCFNVDAKAWYRWTNVPCNFLCTRTNKSTGIKELVAFAPSGFVNKLNQTVLTDFGNPISMRIKTMAVFPNGVVPGEKHFTNLIFLFRSHGTYTFQYSYNIDDVISYSGSIQQKTKGNNILGTTSLGTGFTLGETSIRMKPYFEPVKGVGHSIEIEIEQNGASQDLEIFGLGIEYQGASEAQNPYRNFN
jgi:hypothetical protein